MINSFCKYILIAVTALAPLWSNNAISAQTASANLPITMAVTNPQCTINNGQGLPATVQLPVVTTAGVFADNNSTEVPIVINCAGSVSKFEITLTGGTSSKITTSNNMVDIALVWKQGGSTVQFGAPVALNKAPYLVSNKEFDASLIATVTPHTGNIPAGIYTASLPITLTYY